MNERAVELYKQAVTFAYNTAGKDAGKGTVIESLTAGKFAELIVKECINCADIVGRVNLASGYPNSTAHHVKQKIQEHFGVEE